MATRTLNVEITGDNSNLRRVLGDTDRQLDRLGKQTSVHARVTSRGFAGMAVAARGMAAGVAGAAGGFAILAKAGVTAASDINESLTKNQVLFGKYAQTVDEFSKRSAVAFGISRKAALEYTGVFGNLFRALGVGRQESAKFSTNLTKLAADMASFNNTSIDDALEAIRSGLVGETEPLRRFGVNLNDATLRAQALSMGLTNTTKNVLTPYQRSLAAMSLITKQTSAAHGDFARTSSGLANQMRILKARLSDASAELGSKLLPYVLKAVTAINELAESFSSGRRSSSGFVRAISSVIETVKDAIASVQRWARRNREDLQDIATAFLRVRKVILDVLNATVVPALKFAGRVVKQFALIWGDMVSSVAAIINGDWRKAAENFQQILRRARDGIYSILKGLVVGVGKFVFNIGKSIVNGILRGMGNLGHEILDKVKGALDWVGDQITGLGSSIGRKLGIGDGLGKAIGDGLGSIPLIGPGGNSLMGADADLAPFAGFAAQFGLHTSSGLRPGSITSSGNVSYHSSGDAIDEAGSPSAMMRFATFMRGRFGPRLRELIYTPMGLGIKDGRPYRYSGQVAADHYDHVHVAYTGPFGDGFGRKPGTGDGNGRFTATAYGPPWNAMNGTGVTSTGVNLRNAPHRYGIAVDPSVIPLGTKVKAWPNPFGYRGFFTAFDTGGAIKGRHIDFYDWRGRRAQLGWGTRTVTLSTAGGGTTGGRAGPGAQSVLGGRAGQGHTELGALNVSGGFTPAEIEAQEALDIAEAGEDPTRLDPALTRRRTTIGARALHIRRLLRRKGSRRIRGARRVRLLEELAGIVTEDQGLVTRLGELRAPPSRQDFINADIAMAGLTPGSEDDIAAARGNENYHWQLWQAALRSGDPRRIAEATDEYKQTRDALAALTGALEEANRLQQQRDDLLREQVSNQQQILRLANQGPQILAAVVAAVSGDIGGRVGLGFQTPSYPGGLARYGSVARA